MATETIQLPKGVNTFNEAFFDGLVRHQIGLLRLSGSIRNDVFELLDATEVDIRKSIEKLLANHNGFDSPRSVQRLGTLLRQIEGTRAKAWKQINKDWVQKGIDLSKAEPAFTAEVFKMAVPVVLETALPSAEFLTAIAKSRPFQGKVLKEWAATMAADDLKRISDTVKIGMVQGNSSQAIARAVLGTKGAGGTNGTTQLTRNAVNTITRTMVNAIASQARREYFKSNKDIFPRELYVSTLDDRTTAICRSLDGRKFQVGRGPIPPIHFNCRSLRVGIIDPKIIGDRPARAFTQKGLVREFSDGKFTNRNSLPRGQKGKFDDFSARRMRELTGRVPAKVNYSTWLKRQSAGFQDDVLGKTQGALFRRGDLPLTKFADQRTFREFNLSELAKDNRNAFVKAGLDPEDFI